MFDSIVIGSGCAGAVVARELAEKGNKKVLVIDKRPHVGGNCYDAPDEYGILVHVYGPHIFHTNNDKVYNYLSQFTDWYHFKHEVQADVYGKYIPVPFNLNTLEMVYGDKAPELKEKLVKEFGMEARVPILQLMNHPDKDIQEIAKYVYENIFLKYTMKQWGQKPEDIDPAVTGRVPVLISYDNGYFQDKYQGMPLDGFTPMFEKMLDHPNITVKLSTDAKTLLELKNGKIYYEGEEFKGNVIFTGQIDELFDQEYGMLPYRTLSFKFEHFDKDYVLPKGVINYTVSEDYTRITEFKWLTNQKLPGSTTIMKEYSSAYTGSDKEIPYYAIINESNLDQYGKYKEKAEEFSNLYLLGRLAEYKYYNIDAIVAKALDLAETLLENNK